MLTVTEHALAPFDWARGRLLRALVRRPLLRTWLVARDRRIALVASLGICAMFFLTLVAPAAIYATSPIVLGVPHVASDVRYLVVRRGLPRLLVIAVLVWCAMLLLVRSAELFWPVTLMPLLPARLELCLAGSGVLGLAIFAAWQRHAWRRGVSFIAVTTVLFGAALVYPEASRLVFAHAHNLVAVALWLVLFRKSRRALWLPLSLLCVASALILGGATFSTVVALSGHNMLGQNLLEVAAWLAPGLGTFGVYLTLAYVFWQSIHYAVWLGWIPQEETRGQGSLTFRQSLRSLLSDFGVEGALVVVTGMVLLAVFACFSLHRTRDLYLFLAGFHAYLEIAMLGYLLIRKP